MFNIARALPRFQGRYVPVPMTVIRDTNSSLAFRRTADGYDARRALRAVETRDEMLSFDQQTRDSAGVFLVGELERLDQRLHMPLASVTWHEDIDLREDVTIADEVSSYTNSTFAMPSGVPGSNKNWVGKDSNAIPSPGLEIGKTAQQLPLWALEVSWTLPELQSAARLGRSVDDQKYKALQLKYQMDVDEETYMGDTALGLNGMLNHSLLTNVGNAPNGTWATATPTAILADFNAIIETVWGATGASEFPTKVLLAPPDLGILAGTLISSAGNISVLRFLMENNTARAYGRTIEIQARKWLLGTGNTFGGFTGVGPTATNCMFAYSQSYDHVRLPLVPLLRTPLEWRGIRQITTYYGRIGSVELVYPNLAARFANID